MWSGVRETQRYYAAANQMGRAECSGSARRDDARHGAAQPLHVTPTTAYGVQLAVLLSNAHQALPRVSTVNGTFRAADRFCSARRCPRPRPPEGQMDFM